jgi:hypothetical protein
MNTTDSIPLTNFILESKRNLRVAEAAYSHFKAARENLMRGFFGKLSAQLSRNLPGWIPAYRGPFFVERYGCFDVWKPSWRKQYAIRLEAWEHGARMIYGVWRDEEEIRDRPRSAELLRVLKEAMPAAKIKARTFYEAEITMHAPEPDWRLPGVLWRIHDDDEFLREVAAQILEVARPTEGLIDGLVATYAKGRTKRR